MITAKIDAFHGVAPPIERIDRLDPQSGAHMSPSFHEPDFGSTEDLRERVAGLPDYEPNAEWIALLKRDPRAMERAMEDWWRISLWGCEHAQSREVLSLPCGYSRLTQLLMVFLDAEVTSIDSVALRDVHDILYAREGELVDLISEVCFESVEELGPAIRRAHVVRERVLALARQKLTKPLKQRREPSPSENKINAVREVVSDNPKATRKAIQAELSRRGGSGISNDDLTHILNRLRDEGVYKVRARKRSEKPNG